MMPRSPQRPNMWLSENGLVEEVWRVATGTKKHMGVQRIGRADRKAQMGSNICPPSVEL